MTEDEIEDETVKKTSDKKGKAVYNCQWDVF